MVFCRSMASFSSSSESMQYSLFVGYWLAYHSKHGIFASQAVKPATHHHTYSTVTLQTLPALASRIICPRAALGSPNKERKVRKVQGMPEMGASFSEADFNMRSMLSPEFVRRLGNSSRAKERSSTMTQVLVCAFRPEEFATNVCSRLSWRSRELKSVGTVINNQHTKAKALWQRKCCTANGTNQHTRSKGHPMRSDPVLIISPQLLTSIKTYRVKLSNIHCCGYISLYFSIFCLAITFCQLPHLLIIALQQP